jgi:hypothetical protein
MFFRRAAAGGPCNAAHAGDLKEGSAIHIKWRLPELKKKDRLKIKSLISKGSQMHYSFIWFAGWQESFVNWKLFLRL